MNTIILLFLAIIFIEWIYVRKQKITNYSGEEVLSNILNGLGQQALYIVLGGGGYLIYKNFASQSLLHQSVLAFKDQSTLLYFFIVFLLVDLTWYTLHRVSHRVNLFWASHIAHHHAREFNHASALRQSWTSRLVISGFYLPFAFVGIPVEDILALIAINTFIQFMTHNGVYHRSLPWVEKVFVTPKLHYVHHGKDAPYIDKNYGGVLILWDRWFGTFQDLDPSKPVQIGTNENISYLNPFTSNFQFWKQMMDATLKTKSQSLSKVVKIWFGTPESFSVNYSNNHSKSDPLFTLKKPKLSKLSWMLGTLTLLTLLFAKHYEQHPDFLKLRVLFILFIFGMIFVTWKSTERSK